MGLRELIGKTNKKPVILPPSEPVNYKTVLNWMLGLSDPEYNKILEVLTIYRNADSEVLRIFAFPDTPTTKLFENNTEAYIEDKLDQMLLKDAVQSSVPGVEYELTPKNKPKQSGRAKK